MLRSSISRSVVALGVALAATGCSSQAYAAEKFVEVAPAIPGEYVVVLPSDLPADLVAGEAGRLAKTYGGRVTQRYAEPDSSLRGFAVRGMAAERARALAEDPRVEYVEQAASASPAWRRTSPGWALDRIDQRAAAPSGDFRYSADGEGVHVYVLDTGIDAGHPEFSQTQVSLGFDATGGTGAPCSSHGTAMAGLIAGSTTGVAPRADIVSVKVLNCNPIGNGTPAIIAGVQWVAAHATPPAVVNLSLQLSPGSVSPTLRTAIADLLAKNVVVVAAAGNDNDDVAQVEPANYPGVLAVGGSVMSGSRWVNSGSPTTGCNASAPGCGSNFGAAVRLFAPASARSAALGGGYDTPVGTSVSAAFVSGAAAATLQAFWSPPKPGVVQLTTPSEQARRILLANATTGAVSDLRGSADRLLYAETWPMGVASFDLPGVTGPTAVAANPFAYGATPGLAVSAGLADRFAPAPALTGDPFSAQAFDGDTPRWSPPPAISQAGCADIDDIGIAHLWVACTRLTSQVPQGFVRAMSVYDGTTVGESAVGLGLPVAGQTCGQPRSVARAVRVDSGGSVYAGGDTWCGTGTRNGFLAQLDTPAGYTFWQRRIFDQGTTSSSANALAAGGGIVTVAGAADGAARFGQFRASDGLPLTSFSPALAGPSAAYAVSQDEASGRVYASAQDASGTGVVYAFGAGLTKQWEQSLSGARINAVAALKDGVLIAGETTRYLPFWPVTDSHSMILVGMPLGRPRGFLMRYDQSGALRWTHYVNDGAVVGLAAEGRAESGSSILADVVATKPNPPCPPGPWACLQLPDRGVVGSFRIG
jgi:hypothetical protein